LQAGVYRLTFNVQNYQFANQSSSFYPYVVIVFEVSDIHQHYHVPLLLSAYGYSTYRGS
jgi:5-hydroxyisourate hydrolase